MNPHQWLSGLASSPSHHLPSSFFFFHLRFLLSFC
ncbi:hypothetical protein BT93_A0909 [Corymbia citriodora subsp. variegata]|nr:hypothetical protein BT93_A0909 [Corymbia citriodora subsp. variegata]